MNYKLNFKEYAEALYESLKEDVYFNMMKESIEDKKNSKEIMIKYFDYSILESEKYGEVFMPSERKFGLSLWFKPNSEELVKKRLKERKDFILKELGKNSLKLYTCVNTFMSRKSDSLIVSDTWYLSIIGVLPAFQNQGLGKDLINPILRKTDKLGISTYIETFSPRNKSFYKRFGYIELGVFIEPKTNLKYTIMCREAQNI